MKSLNNKVALITGASSGIGAACAHALAQQGAKLILLARREDKLQQLAEHLTQTYGSEVISFACDVTVPDSVKKILTQLPANFSAVDLLINNAGLALGLDPMHEAQLQDWDQMIDTNIKGLLYVTRHILPIMRTRNMGHIVNIGSTAGLSAYSGGSVYCATKHAVHALTKTLSLEVAGTALRVTEIDPGMVETEFSVIRFKGDNARANKVYENLTPLTAQDVADAILYAVTRPAHVNIAQMVLYPVDQPAAVRLH